NIYTDTKALLDFGFSKYYSCNLEDTQNASEEDNLPFFNAFSSIFDTANAPLKTDHAVKITIPVGVKKEKVKQKVSFQKIDSTTHQIGTVTYTYGQKNVGSTNIYFDQQAGDQSLITSNDLHFSNRSKIAGAAKTRLFVLRILGGTLALAVIIGSLSFYLLVIRKRQQLRKDYYNARRRY
ncbi:MAG: hypothetical protein II073_00670, partial [Lachnospiraceae bacterium]|nr:hypothetical protein [Lachnospiraceae bacterium]